MITLPTKGIGGHHRGYEGRTDEWLTPPSILKSLGPFDLDPCSPVDRPWDTAAKHYTVQDDGLSQPWAGRVFLNPPYGPELAKWLGQMAAHGNGVALVFARTETDAFHRYVWPRASGILFLRGRIHFHYVTGERAAANAGAPSVLIAYGEENGRILSESGIDGRYCRLDSSQTGGPR